MTAIAAIASCDGESLRNCKRMIAALRVYGRDRESLREVEGAALAVAHATRTPEDRFDRQPISLAQGKLTLVADCRIDNREDIVSALGVAGASRLSDAAIAAQAFERWGVASFDRLRGDFAIGIWDAECRRFIVARDPAGNAPLFFHAAEGVVALASMPRGLHALDRVARRADTDFMTSSIRHASMFGAGSFWDGIGRVLPGHFGFLDALGLRQERYWFPPTKRISGGSFDDYAAGLRGHVERAVSRRLRGATEVATHLSAGLDSGAVTGAAATLLLGSGRVTAFTAAPREGFEARQDTRLEDEAPLAKATARMHPNLEHVVIRSPQEWTTAAIETVFDYWQAPMANICNLGWMEEINKAAHSRGLRVLMPASVGNLALSYNGSHALSEAWVRRDWLGLGTGMLSRVSSPLRLAKELAYILTGSIRPVRSNPTALHYPGRDDPADPRFALTHADMLLQALSRVDRGSHHKGVLGRWGIDIRDPSTDRDLIDYVATVPMQMFRRHGADRALIRRAADRWMAPAALSEHRRGLQAADWYEHYRAHWGWIAEQLDAIENHAEAAKVVDVPRLRRILQETPRDWRDPHVQAEHRHALLRGIAAGHFIRRANGANR